MLRSFPGGKIATGCGLFRTQMKCSFHLKFPFVCLSCWGPYYLCWDLHDLRLVRFCWCCREYLYLPFWQLFLLLLQVGWHTTFCHCCINFWCPHLDFGAWHVHHSFVLACVSFLCALVLAFSVVNQIFFHFTPFFDPLPCGIRHPSFLLADFLS